jgi:hypothetical protein
MSKKGPGSFGSQGSLEKAFAKQPNSVGNMHAPAMGLHQTTMAPTKGIGASLGATFGTPAGLPPTPSSAKQSPKQHIAVEKAAQASAAKRRKY